ncbi:uncharacterized protein BCR38DRAFT_412728 [Pseudomassariella vexata]|uniref:Uncharacterized protein n=1 Tax=Pseudomassariella vexata TaxID=1141098 RepID=A0A1Y2DKQ4_9PEZI|nr:uncharacterized protein BCR38DRAFT_412728 [Pseudomassariella vexata]ORY59734.1 hypothetical protein BCR38DRAFT_412728 [Pseudomassariella vexata]
MPLCIGFKEFATRLQHFMGRKPKAKRRSITISAPYNFKHESANLPGISEDEITILKEKAAASRLGVADGAADGGAATAAPSASLRIPGGTSPGGRPTRPAPPSPVRTTITPSVHITPNTPISPSVADANNMI